LRQRCYGSPSSLPAELTLKYLFAKAVGRGPSTYEEFVDFWGEDTRQCEPMKN
jgi:hypothetical protein